MELFYSSDVLYGSPIPGSLLDAQAADKADGHDHLARFLQAAEVLKVAILPLVWDPGFPTLGLDGSTGRLSQSSLNAEMAFAYKRFNPQVTRNDISEAVFRRVQHDAMIAEMAVLSCPDIRRHPNIVDFVGVCFEISPLSDGAWPVHVFAKADLGNLHTFLSACGPLAVETLISIFTEVAKGIHMLHRCGTDALFSSQIAGGVSAVSA